MNTTPPAVTIGPPSIGMPILNGSGIGELSRTVPMRFFHTIELVLRSIAEM